MAKKKAVTKNIPSETPIPILDTNVDYTIKVVCKNEKQKSFVNSIKNIRKEICFGVGSAGSGKTFLALATALKMLKTNIADNIKIETIKIINKFFISIS